MAPDPPFATGTPEDRPPRPPLVFRVVVAGHRPERLVDPRGVEDSVRSVLGEVVAALDDLPEEIRAVYSSAAPVLRVVTGLAEGTDQLAAKVAATLGFELQAVLPFARADFERDFEGGGADPASTVRRFRETLAAPATTAILELDGVLALSYAATALGTADTARATRELSAAHLLLDDAPDPYQGVGAVLLGQADLVLGVWDGQDPRGPGGTGAILRRARALNLPVVIIDAGTPSDISFSHGSERPAAFEAGDLRRAIYDLLAPPEPEEHVPNLRPEYYRERRPGWVAFGRAVPFLGTRSLLNWLWPTLRDILGASRPAAPNLRAGAFDASTGAAAEWSGSGVPSAMAEQIDRGLGPHYGWADGLASYYGNRYRTTFVLIYVMGAMSVALAVAGLAGVHFGTLGRFDMRLLVSLGLLFSIVGIWFIGGFRKRWHQRWLEYRILAEYLRQLRYLSVLSASAPHVRLPPHRSPGDPASSWMAWHVRAVGRKLGIVSAHFDREFLDSARRLIGERWIDAQAEYHAQSATKYRRMERVLHVSGLCMFGGAFLLVGAALVEERVWLGATEAILPALGSALAAIRGQAELERLSKRSAGISVWLSGLGRDLELLSAHGGAGLSAGLARTAESAASGMLDEVLDWRVMLEARPLELPG